jgi:hypothetical protein
LLAKVNSVFMLEDSRFPLPPQPFRDLTGAGEEASQLAPKERQLQYLDNAELFEILNAEYIAYKAFRQRVMTRVQSSLHS